MYFVLGFATYEIYFFQTFKYPLYVEVIKACIVITTVDVLKFCTLIAC